MAVIGTGEIVIQPEYKVVISMNSKYTLDMNKNNFKELICGVIKGHKTLIPSEMNNFIFTWKRNNKKILVDSKGYYVCDEDDVKALSDAEGKYITELVDVIDESVLSTGLDGRGSPLGRSNTLKKVEVKVRLYTTDKIESPFSRTVIIDLENVIDANTFTCEVSTK